MLSSGRPPSEYLMLIKEKEKRRSFWDTKDFQEFASQVDLALLSSMHDFIEKNPTVKFIINGAQVFVYAESSNQIERLAHELGPAFYTSMTSIIMPENQQQQTLLAEGLQLTGSKNKFKYKAYVRTGIYTSEQKYQLHMYLKTLDPVVAHGSKSLMDSLAATHGYIWPGHINSNDLGVMTFLSLICPVLISRIQEMVVVNK
jgi:hypothetical protein